MDSSVTRQPSFRHSLHRKPATLSNYQTRPITKHYEVNYQILNAFESNYEQKIYHVAYALGLQFVETALLEIPKHGYFYSQRHERERMQSALDAVRVAHLLQDLQEHGEVQIPSSAHRRVQRLTRLALEQVEQASNDQAAGTGSVIFETNRKAAEAELRQYENGETWLCEPFLACADSLSGLWNERSSRHQQPPPPPPLEIAYPIPPNVQNALNSAASAKSLSRLPENEDEERTRSISSVDLSHRLFGASSMTSRVHSAPSWPRESVSSAQLEPPILLRASQSSGSVDLMDGQLEKALFLSGLEISMSNIDADDEVEKTKLLDRRSSQRLEFATLRMLYHEDFDSMRLSGRIRISYASTYQGRVPESTNGCTVIAPLLCIHHLLDYYDGLPDPGLTDAIILQVIDLETPSILTQLRKQLGLSDQAFLIPSDSHDYLIEQGQLSQQQFFNVIGGNILDDTHLTAFVDALREGQEKCKRVAATLFFHEHVIAILQVRRTATQAWYDVIDSLPLKDTMIRAGESEHEFHERLGLNLCQEEFDLVHLPMTARIRCLDGEALFACLRWYACSKFNDENIQYIDQYVWDDNSCDFDPRVFQAFIWREVPQ